MIREVTTCEVRPLHDIPAVYSWVVFFFITFVSCIIVYKNLIGLSINLGILIIRGGIVAVSEHVVMVTQSEIDCKCTVHNVPYFDDGWTRMAALAVAPLPHGRNSGTHLTH